LFYIRALFLVLRDYFRIFGDSVVVDWVMDLFTKVMYAGFLHYIYTFSFERAFSLSIVFSIAPSICIVSRMFWA
jgi:hypothetical protein